MLEVIGAPFDLCGRRHGSALGPAALRHAGLFESFAPSRLEIFDKGDIEVLALPDTDYGMRNFAAALQAFDDLKAKTTDSLRRGACPLVVGGDHSISIGSVAAALEFTKGDLALLWIDAHADVNTPNSSPSGNLHGMPIAALMGLASGCDDIRDTQWNTLLRDVVPETRLGKNRVAWIGLREVDPSERVMISMLDQTFATTMNDIDRVGVDRVVRGFDRWMRSTGAKHLWISFDVDVLDPVLAPGTGTSVRGGLTYREGHYLAELLRELLDAPDRPFDLVGLDVVEVNPLFDEHNETARIAVEWLNSLFGKTILEGHGHLVL